MDKDRQVFAVFDLLTNFAYCVLWWFTFARFRRARVFLCLAIIATFSAALSVANLQLAFSERLFISFSSSASMFAFLRALSYLCVGVSLVQTIAVGLLVRWIVQNVRR